MYVPCRPLPHGMLNRTLWGYYQVFNIDKHSVENSPNSSVAFKGRLHDRKDWNGSDKKTNGSDKI